eukprot:5748075-Amphidinium_carterae.1
MHLGGETSEAAGERYTRGWDRAPTERLSPSGDSRGLRRGVLRYCARFAGLNLAKPKGCLRCSAPPPKICSFPRGHLFGSVCASGEPDARRNRLYAQFNSRSEASEDPSLRIVLPGERSEGQDCASVPRS